MKKFIIAAAAVAAIAVSASAQADPPDGKINFNTGFCVADAFGPTAFNDIIATTNGNVHYSVTPNGKVNIACQFEDISNVYEAEAEQGRLDKCVFTIDAADAPDGFVHAGTGTGHVVASAKDGAESGGNATIRCMGYLGMV